MFDEATDAVGTIVLAHGAGGGMNSDFMTTMAAGVADGGWRVVRFEFPYVVAGRKAPDRPPVLEETLRPRLAEGSVGSRS